MCPLYISGLICRDDRKSIQPNGDWLSLGEYGQLQNCLFKRTGVGGSDRAGDRRHRDS
jgi:hypothetical protein